MVKNGNWPAEGWYGWTRHLVVVPALSGAKEDRE